MKGEQAKYLDEEERLIKRSGGITGSVTKASHIPQSPPPAPSRDEIVRLLTSIDWDAWDRKRIFDSLLYLKEKNYGRR